MAEMNALKQTETIKTFSEQETLAAGQRFSENLKPGDIVLFFGGLGCGKTVMIKGICAGLGVSPETVNSPTFVLLNQYQGRIDRPVNIHHFDFYRLANLREIGETGFHEFCGDPDTVCLAEWAERLEENLPEQYWRISLAVNDDGARTVEIRTMTTSTA